MEGLSHLDITEELDISQIPESARNENAFRRVFRMMEEARNCESREGIIKRFLEYRAQAATILGRQGQSYLSITHSFDVKPKSELRHSLDGLAPMLISELNLGSTHRGHYLCGHVAISDAFASVTSGNLLLEDIAGDLVNVAVYDLQKHQRRRIAKLFPQGRGIAIIEPYYKRRMDFTRGIRIDEPREIVSWNRPQTVNAWKELGNEFMLRVPQHTRGALMCYNAALKQVSPTSVASLSLLQSLLMNLSICRHSFGEYMQAARLAAMASVIDPSVMKPKYLLSKSFLELGRSCKRQHPALHVAKAIIESVLSSSSITKDEAVQFKELIEPLHNCLHTQCREYGNHAEIMRWLKLCPAEYSWCGIPDVVDWKIFEQEVEINIDHQEKLVNALKTKEKGSKLFREGKRKEAQECYLQALYNSKNLSDIVKDVAVVLSNKATALSIDADEAEEREEGFPRLPDALANCCVSALLDHSNWKPWVRQVYIVEKLLGRRAAEQWCNRLLQVLDMENNSPDVTKITEKLSAKQEILTNENRMNVLKKSVSQVPTSKQREERDATLPHIRGDHVEDEALSESLSESLRTAKTTFALMRMMIKSDPFSEIRFGRLCERKCPQIHEELLKEHGIPSGIDSQIAYQILEVAANEARFEPWCSSHMIAINEFRFTAPMKVKRWHGIGRLYEVEQSRESMKPGDIVDSRMEDARLGFSYSSSIRSNFGNSPSSTETMFHGTTHVSVGFNDLGCLLSAKFCTLETTESTRQAVRFVGFEKSEFSVAKSRVLAQMIGDPTVPLVHVLQVWYSSTWSNDTLNSFRRSVPKVLAQYKEFPSPSEENIETYLQRWMIVAPVSVASARQTFMKDGNTHGRRNFSNICSFRRAKDRLALCHYFLTGEILPSDLAMKAHERYMGREASGSQQHFRREEALAGLRYGHETTDFTDSRGKSAKGGRASKKGRSRSRKAKNMKKVQPQNKKSKVESSTAEKAAFGSVTAWSVPAGSPPLEESNALGVVLVKDLVAERGVQGPDMNIVDLFVVRTLRKLHQLRERLVQKALTVELYPGVVDALNKPQAMKMARRIGDLKPKTISWSNVLDYMELGAFHELARLCSDARDTIHYGYSMNWVAETYGTNIMDYDQSTQGGKRVVNAVLNKTLGKEAIVRARETGSDKFLFIPLFDAQLNLSGFELAQKLHSFWVTHFCEKALVHKGERNGSEGGNGSARCGASTTGFKMVEYYMSDQFPLYRSDLNVYMKWTYDENSRCIGQV
ncbi:hypothetical protein BWQ96_05207 [Gracilariopsis chorda]|uniref:Uncharacterized protein n=1 Tax=Gracilariopsis chorda TaxID=448386 RepID=A0A2V3ISF5_9FLOR|nr:hypothetical protein BWQ96_05207 [Gracilariopsis chorda]|eukprot:PXF45034.1 hypothetical protein BWQ96_05207 [Gracilariopsis chorda]